MSLSMALFTFLNAWWISLFLVLPLGVEPEENPGAMDYVAAPKKIRWRKKFLQAAILAAFFTALIAMLIHLYRN